MKFAAIDIGSNSIKLLVVDATAGDSFTVLTREREVVRLGHETLLAGHISQPAILRAADSIGRYLAIATAHGVERIVATATASVREANNSEQFLSAVEQKTGLRVEVLSGIEEARLIGLAAATGCAPKGSTSLNIDIGGGSTEISIFRDGTPVTLLSVKLGAIGLTERFLKSDPPRSEELAALQGEIHATLEQLARELREQKWDFVTGTSGTVLTIGGALRARSEKDNQNNESGPPPVDVIISLPELRLLNATLSRLSVAERRAAARLTLQRAQVIVAGGLVLEKMMDVLGIESLHSCDWALREGLVIDRLRDVWSGPPAGPPRGPTRA